MVTDALRHDNVRVHAGGDSMIIEFDPPGTDLHTGAAW